MCISIGHFRIHIVCISSVCIFAFSGCFGNVSQLLLVQSIDLTLNAVIPIDVYMHMKIFHIRYNQFSAWLQLHNISAVSLSQRICGFAQSTRLNDVITIFHIQYSQLIWFECEFFQFSSSFSTTLQTDSQQSRSVVIYISMCMCVCMSKIFQLISMGINKLYSPKCRQRRLYSSIMMIITITMIIVI